ncbi:MAG: thiolase C-terminal domain-containing protein [Streptosporangiaceae bacterium]
MRDRLAAVAGIYEYPKRLAPGLSPWQIKAASAAEALADAGLAWTDVDAVYDCGDVGQMGGVSLTQYLELRPTVIDSTAVGGSSFEFHVAHATDAIARGRAKVALLTYGSTARSQALAIGTGLRAGQAAPPDNMESPWGLTLVGNYALVATRHMHQYGTTPEQLAEIAVVARAHALRNPAAIQGLAAIGITLKQITVADVVASRMIADPLHLLDCCLITDGGGALVLVSPEVAKDIRRPPVWVIGTGEAIGYVTNDSDITTSAGAQSGPQAFDRAGLRPDEVDIAMIYDSFTITVLTILEDLGFCKKGEGGPFVESRRLRWDSGQRPALNTDGGGLSSNHPGMRGLFLLIEATRQLRGESTAQVPGARIAVAHGNGGYLGSRHSAGTILLAKD